MAVSLPHHRFTVAEYERMAEVGLLTEDDRVELIRGEIVQMSPIGGRHIQCVNRLTRILSRSLGDRALISVQNPLRLPPDTEPQPDLAVLQDRDYGDTVPMATDALFVIEVADTSREYDRATKLPLYAAAGIAEAWLIDLVAARIERHTDPSPDGYQQIALAGRGKTLVSTVIPALTIATGDLLGPPR
jgi:Uma2 family endonuclease